MAYRMVQVGTGGMGLSWCRGFLPPNIKDGLIEVVAAVDINPASLENARQHLGLAAEKCYTDLERALDENAADFCTVVVPPSVHERVIDAALAHDMHILSEKPIADTLVASIRVVDKVRRSGKKMGITMNHRCDQDKTTLRQQLCSGDYGRLDYLVWRYIGDFRRYGSWGGFRHDIPDPQMVDAAVHHLDILADLAGARCDTIYAQTRNPPWGEFAGDSQSLVMMTFENGVRATYEGVNTNAVALNNWNREYIRAECEKATLVLDRRDLTRYRYGGGLAPEGLPLLQQLKWKHTWLIEKFVRWLDGGDPMETRVEDNLHSLAMCFAGIESSRTGRPIKVKEFLEAAKHDR
ncbi:MAG: Gfo/Idh/MocA family oxidoreductase [SAR202 cluster bacterium]|nr:Gfo/Idh/MocA family oxidoreductase [SAR202 cluster bacterium]